MKYNTLSISGHFGTNQCTDDYPWTSVVKIKSDHPQILLPALIPSILRWIRVVSLVSVQLRKNGVFFSYFALYLLPVSINQNNKGIYGKKKPSAFIWYIWKVIYSWGIKVKGNRILGNLFSVHCFLIPYTHFFWTLELQQRVQILRDYIFLPVEQVYVCLKLWLGN